MSQSDEESNYSIYPGICLKNKYILIREIGCGNNASVWVCYSIPSKQFLAMKIQYSECYSDGCNEINLLGKIKKFIEENSSIKTHCIEMKDNFIYSFEDRKYVCSIFDLYASNLYNIISSGRYMYGIPVNIVKRITRQILECLVLLHDNLSIIHTDLKPENILINNYNIEYYTPIFDLFDQKRFHEEYEKNPNDLENIAFDCVKENDYFTDSFLNDKKERPLRSENERPRRQSIDDSIEEEDKTIDLESIYDFNSVYYSSPCEESIIDEKSLMNSEFIITDFGNSFFYSKRTTDEIQDRLYRAPEIILNLKYGYGCDIWSLGCMIYELLTGSPLFEPEENELNKDINHLFLMEKLLGPIPIEMKKLSNRSHFLFDKKRNYHVKNVKKIKRLTIRERLIIQHLYDEKEAEEIEEFISLMLEYDTSIRATAKDLLSHPWLDEHKDLLDDTTRI